MQDTPLRTGVLKAHSSVFGTGGSVSIIQNTSDVVIVAVKGIEVKDGSTLVTEDWIVTLHSCERSASINMAGSTAASFSAKMVMHGMGFKALSIYGLFQHGVVQMKQGRSLANSFVASSPLSRLYAIGGSPASAIDMRQTIHDGTDNNIITIMSETDTPSGFKETLAGTFSKQQDVWSSGWMDASVSHIASGITWNVTWDISPNNRNFPALGQTTDVTIPVDDLSALMTGAYGSSPGCLCTYPNEVEQGQHVYQIAPTM